LISHCRFPYKKIDFFLSLFVYILFALFPSTLINSPVTVRGLTLVFGCLKYHLLFIFPDQHFLLRGLKLNNN